jgi:hypothetical protein
MEIQAVHAVDGVGECRANDAESSDFRVVRYHALCSYTGNAGATVNVDAFR